MPYELYYWPSLQGRGEFIRLALEEAGAPYLDVARHNGAGAIAEILRASDHHPFAPPILADGAVVISHVANILFYLGPRLKLAPEAEAERHDLNALQLTITDLTSEVHDTHHPISTALYYEDQKEAAKTNAQSFLGLRAPKYLAYFERFVSSNPAGWALGATLTYVDLSLFQVWEGLHYAFPNATRIYGETYPHLKALVETVRLRPHIASYLASPRRIPFNETGIFRHYPELDRDSRP